jgi:hypothetical protein
MVVASYPYYTKQLHLLPSGPGLLRRTLQDLPAFDLQQLPALACHDTARLLQQLPPAGQCYTSSSSQQQQQQQQGLAGALGSSPSCDAQLWRAYMALAFLTHVSNVGYNSACRNNMLSVLLCCYFVGLEHGSRTAACWCFATEDKAVTLA